MAFVLVQHLDPHHKSALTHLLTAATSMPVLEITNNLRIEANCVYVIPPNASLSIAQGVLKLEPRRKRRNGRHSIDLFLESLALDQRERAIGVILSGAATDGTLGLEAIKAAGGITFAQDDSARYDSMPHSAIAAGCVDFVLGPEDIAKAISRIAKHPIVVRKPVELPSADDGQESAIAHDEAAPSSAGHDTPTNEGAHRGLTARRPRAGDDPYEEIVLRLGNHSGVEFSLYKSTTVKRRIARRMALKKQDSLEGYAGLLRRDAKELDALYRDILISVTGFFRNPEAFEVLKLKVFPRFFRQHVDEPVRIWAPGCSTGQEAYSIAMAFAESAENALRARKLHMFATDLNDALLDEARRGFYPTNLVRGVSPERLRRFFVEEEGGYRIVKSLRETMVFARQNVMSDPPLSRMDLVSCRNLLIYLETRLHRKVLATLHYALNPEGVLFLGASESVGGFTDLFEPIDKKHKIFSKKLGLTPTPHAPDKKVRGERPSPAPSHVQFEPARMAASKVDEPQGWRAEIQARREADRLTLRRYAPSGVLVNSDLQILQFRGTTGAYLEPPTGKARFDVLGMAREGLRLPLRSALDEARQTNETARRQQVRIKQNGATLSVNVEVIPLETAGERSFLILFEDAEHATRASPERSRGTTKTPRHATMKQVAELKRELSETRRYLQSIREDYEATSEELQASNEEAQSANEELQSINEELETSKEELESANEELITVNEEMTRRNDELNHLNNDLINLQTSTKLPIMLLGRDLTIRRFSPEAEKQLNLQAADIGRPVSGVRHNLDLADLDGFVKEAIMSVRENDREVQDKDGRWRLLRVHPYITADNGADGAVLVLMDIDKRKKMEQAVLEERDFADAIIRTAPDPLVVMSSDLRIQSANDAFYRTFRLSPADTEKRSIFEVDGAWETSSLPQLLEDTISRNSSFNDIEVALDFDRIGRRTMLLNARPVARAQGRNKLIVLGIRDITDVLAFQAQLRRSETRYRRLFEAAQDGVLILDLGSRKITDANPFITALLGYARDELLGKQLWEIGVLKDEKASQAAFRELLEKGQVRYEDLPLQAKSGESRQVEVIANRYDEDGMAVAQYSIRDITDRKRAEERERLLANELAHRGKNLLGVFQAMVSLSLSGTRSLAEAREALMQRVQALARSQSLLTGGGFEGARLAEIIRLEFKAFSDQVEAVGPDVILNPRAVQTFAILIHELATNATKYGALSRAGGSIAIAWSFDGAGAEARFKFRWQERGGPPVAPPAHKGFGSLLFERVLTQEFGAQPKVSFAPEGLTFEFEAPLPAVGAAPGRRDDGS
jgi:two-component system CheB/CheR fusion protein